MHLRPQLLTIGLRAMEKMISITHPTDTHIVSVHLTEKPSENDMVWHRDSSIQCKPAQTAFVEGERVWAVFDPDLPDFRLPMCVDHLGDVVFSEHLRKRQS